MQPSLFDKPADPPPCTASKPKFHGETYVAKWDEKRLTQQVGRVYKAMLCGRWMTFAEIRQAGGNVDAEPSISARIRQLRDQFGYRIDRRRRGDKRKGLHEYRLVLEQGGGGG